MKLLQSTFALVLSILISQGCAGELENAERFAECPPGFVEKLFQQKCAGICHTGEMPEADLDLTSAGVADRLLMQVSTSDACNGIPILDPNGTSQLFMNKLSDSPTCGARMPFGGAALGVRDIECVRRWVENLTGAP